MSRGKYSPWCHHNKQSDTSYEFNCYGEVPVEWNKEHYGEKTMFDNYDRAGFDRYGYSAFYLDGRYAGVGRGIDRYGYTENEYLCWIMPILIRFMALHKQNLSEIVDINVIFR